MRIWMVGVAYTLAFIAALATIWAFMALGVGAFFEGQSDSLSLTMLAPVLAGAMRLRADLWVGVGACTEMALLGRRAGSVGHGSDWIVSAGLARLPDDRRDHHG